MCRTFVLKLNQKSVVDKHTCDSLLREPFVVEGCYPSAFAIVQLYTGVIADDGLHIVITTSKPRDFDSFTRKLEAAVACKMPRSDIAWTKQLNVRLQRLFGWNAARGLLPSVSEEPSACRSRSITSTCYWLQSADQTATFYVVDLQKISSAEKLLWVRQELGGDASLRSVARKFIELFGSKIRGKAPQKRAILQLYAEYMNVAPIKEADLEPRERSLFLQLWEESSPRSKRRRVECCSAYAHW